MPIYQNGKETTPKLNGKNLSRVMYNGKKIWPIIIPEVIYIDQTIDDPFKRVTGDINGDIIKWIRQNSHRVLAKKTAEGKVTYCRLDDTTSLKYHDGSEAKTDGTEGDVFVKLPTFYYYGTEGDNVELHFAKKKLDDNYIEWDTNILIGAYEAVVRNNKAYSKSGVQSTGHVSQANFKKYAQARGTGYQLVDWQMHCILGCLYYAMYGNTNCQATIGAGVSSYDKINGQTDALGMTDTKASTNGNSQSINFWGLENWWGNKFEWIDNIIVSNREWNITESDGNVRKFNAYTSDGYISKMRFGKYLDLIPTAASATDSTGFCDYYYQSSSSSRVVRRSRHSSHANGGVACAHADYGSSGTGSFLGSRLAFRGVATEAESVAAFKALPVL